MSLMCAIAPLGRRLLVPVGCLLLLIAFAGCKKPKTIEVDRRFSMNVLKTPYWYPDEDTVLTAAERDVHDRFGGPDYIRFWWLDDGTFINSSDLSGKDAEEIQGQLDRMKKSWIYTEDKREIVFLSNGTSWREEKLSEKVRLICQYGDPQQSRPVVREGHTHETWIWMENGLQVELIDGEVAKETRIGTGTGRGTILGK